MLPDPDTPQRLELEAEAMRVGLDVLRRTGDIHTALYESYMWARGHFIEERGLMDMAPCGEHWVEALTDARVLEAQVSAAWTRAIWMAQGSRRPA